MQLSDSLTDDAVLAELGGRLARLRLDSGLTQAQLAEQAGLSKRTLERLEAGQSSQLLSLIRVLRVLGRLGGLEALLPDTGPGPMALLRGKGKPPQRASRRAVAEPKGEWQWGDDE